MSAGKAFGWILAGTCSVATAYYTFAPELQRQQREREAAFQARHQTAPVTQQAQAAPVPKVETPAIQSEQMALEQKEPIKDKIQKSWPGLSWFSTSYGGGSTSEQQDKKD
ncbi:hypothetical protein BDZ85DRAFT_280006 [Elsinoe ampelina]|uniref:Uncharacterized protein n=1 Tax=Elsinoe ampelina TaxID=302913 RepID=A0A6A6GGD1_9PEZI|nr:hypothetical protein BDZ85DRAFT_280006 [Elsinoe ampelina]